MRIEAIVLYLAMVAALVMVGGSLALNDGTFGFFPAAGCISSAIFLTGALAINALGWDGYEDEPDMPPTRAQPKRG